MRVSGKPQAGEGLETESKKWVIAGISLRVPLKAINTNPVDQKGNEKDKLESDDQGEESCSTTLTGEEGRIPTILTCSPAPRKPKPSLKCSYGSVREFFTPPACVYAMLNLEKG